MSKGAGLDSMTWRLEMTVLWHELDQLLATWHVLPLYSQRGLWRSYPIAPSGTVLRDVSDYSQRALQSTSGKLDGYDASDLRECRNAALSILSSMSREVEA